MKTAIFFALLVAAALAEFQVNSFYKSNNCNETTVSSRSVFFRTPDICFDFPCTVSSNPDTSINSACETSFVPPEGLAGFEFYQSSQCNFAELQQAQYLEPNSCLFTGGRSILAICKDGTVNITTCDDDACSVGCVSEVKNDGVCVTDFFASRFTCGGPVISSTTGEDIPVPPSATTGSEEQVNGDATSIQVTFVAVVALLALVTV